MRAVQTENRLLIHLMPNDGDKTICGRYPVAKAPTVVRRSDLCKNCFKEIWEARMIGGLERIIEK